MTNIWMVDDVDEFEHDNDTLLGDPEEIIDPTHEIVIIDENEDEILPFGDLEDDDILEDEKEDEDAKSMG